MRTYEERKAERTAAYKRNHGRKLIVCPACSGSGYYDDTGSPLCGGCGGLGTVREQVRAEFLPPEPPAPSWREKLKAKQLRDKVRRPL